MRYFRRSPEKNFAFHLKKGEIHFKLLHFLFRPFTMTSKSQQLPFELLNNIFKKISKRDCVQCSMTCASWNAAARPIIFENLNHLTDRKMENFWALATDRNSKLQPLRDFVKYVSVSRLSSDFDITVLNTAFPNIEKILLNRSQRIMYRKICQSLCKGGFPKLKMIPLIECDRIYWDLVFARREKIETLQLIEDFRNRPLMEEVFSKLHLMTRVKLFTIVLKSTRSLESLVPGNLSLLRSVSIVCKYPFILFSLTPPLDIQPMRNLETIQIKNHKMFAGGDDFYLYFMKKFPNLVSLELSCMRESTDDTSPQLQSTSVKILSEFLLYLSNVKSKSMVESIPTSQFTADIIHGFLKRLSDQCLKNKNEVEIHMKIFFDLALLPSAKCTLEANYENPDAKTCKLDLDYKIIREETTAFQPCLDLIQKMDNLNVEFLWMGTDRESNAFETTTIPLDKILKHFTEMKSFELDAAPNITFSELPLGFTSNVTAFRLTNCTLYEKIFQRIDQHCPKLEHFYIEDCRFDNEYQFPQHALLYTLKDVHINMPSTSFKKLSLSVLPESPSRCPFSEVFIKLETSKAGPKYSKFKLVVPENYSCISLIDDSKSEYSEEDYMASLLDETCQVYTISCNAIVDFYVMTLDGGSL